MLGRSCYAAGLIVLFTMCGCGTVANSVQSNSVESSSVEAQTPTPEATPLPEVTVADVTASIDRAASWLAEQQVDRQITPVRQVAVGAPTATATALWAAALSDSPNFPDDARLRAVSYLNRFRQRDGSFVDPNPEHAAAKLGFTALISTAFKAVEQKTASFQIRVFSEAASTYVRAHSPDASPATDAIATFNVPGESGGETRAAEFLRRAHGAPAETATAGPRYFPLLTRDEMTALAATAHSAFANGQSLLSVAEMLARDCDTTGARHHGGRAFAYAALAQVLASTDTQEIETPTGSMPWAAHVVAALQSEQHPDGSWGTKSNEPTTATGYAIVALSFCRSVLDSSSNEQESG